MALVHEYSATWNAAIKQYNDITKSDLNNLAATTSIDEVISSVSERESKFSNYRHSGSRADKFRSLLASTLEPVDRLGDVVATVAGTVIAILFSAVKSDKLTYEHPDIPPGGCNLRGHTLFNHGNVLSHS